MTARTATGTTCAGPAHTRTEATADVTGHWLVDICTMNGTANAEITHDSPCAMYAIVVVCASFSTSPCRIWKWTPQGSRPLALPHPSRALISGLDAWECALGQCQFHYNSLYRGGGGVEKY